MLVLRVSTILCGLPIYIRAYASTVLYMVPLSFIRDARTFAVKQVAFSLMMKSGGPNRYITSSTRTILAISAVALAVALDIGHPARCSPYFRANVFPDFVGFLLMSEGGESQGKAGCSSRRFGQPTGSHHLVGLLGPDVPSVPATTRTTIPPEVWNLQIPPRTQVRTTRCNKPLDVTGEQFPRRARLCRGYRNLSLQKRVFRSPLSYRSYRLDNRRETPNLTVTRETCNNALRIRYTFNYICAGNDPIPVLEFLNGMRRGA